MSKVVGQALVATLVFTSNNQERFCDLLINLGVISVARGIVVNWRSKGNTSCSSYIKKWNKSSPLSIMGGGVRSKTLSNPEHIWGSLLQKGILLLWHKLGLLYCMKQLVLYIREHKKNLRNVHFDYILLPLLFLHVPSFIPLRKK